MIGGGGPVQVGPWLASGEFKLARLARRQLQRFVRVFRMAMQAVDSGRNRQRITNSRVDQRSLRNADQWARTLRCAICLGKCIDISIRATAVLRIPAALTQLELKTQRPIAELACRSAVIVRHYGG